MKIIPDSSQTSVQTRDDNGRIRVNPLPESILRPQRRNSAEQALVVLETLLGEDEAATAIRSAYTNRHYLRTLGTGKKFKELLSCNPVVEVSKKHTYWNDYE